jgi:glycosyltransferase involved in cell wall biosynthesis
MSPIAATVLLPTTGDRGPLLPYSVGSVLAQTVQDFEVFIVGDGIDDSTRAAATRLCEQDARVRLFDFPKHSRRGEPHRHEILTTEARGELVAYICDRDLWLPGHLEEVALLLRDADFGYTLRIRIDERDAPFLYPLIELCDRRTRAHAVRSRIQALVSLSAAAHTLGAYRRLPHGWRTTPEAFPTDSYMWLQFLEQPWVTVASSAMPTVLAFTRGSYRAGARHGDSRSSNDGAHASPNRAGCEEPSGRRWASCGSAFAASTAWADIRWCGARATRRHVLVAAYALGKATRVAM